MAQSKLNAAQNAQGLAEPSRPWTTAEAAVEVLATAISASSSGGSTGTSGTANRYVNIGTAATANVSSTPAKLFSFTCFNTNAAVRYIQFHNTATTPSAAAIPVLSYLIPANSQIGIGTDIFTNTGEAFSVGIAYAFSTTATTYTAGSAADQYTVVRYV